MTVAFISFFDVRCIISSAMTTKSKSALNGRTLNIGNLEREIEADVAKYQQYKAEDGMKKRAIHTSKSNDFS